MPDPVVGRIHVSGKFNKLSCSELVVGSSLLPGQHTEEILTKLLNYDREEVRKLEAESAVYRGTGEGELRLPRSVGMRELANVQESRRSR